MLSLKPYYLADWGSESILTVLEAVGLWYEKVWETILVLLLVGISIPPEIYELVQGVTVLKLAVFIANLAVLWYLLHHLPKQGKGA
ncbi:DUF2127 domain-containing protein [Microcoleus sp. herbarium2]|uniref:DUF2127 domain-containing protein n=1 Tax=Microcoleus sp. herbarium2 TaxID=3055433 RepID=UPI002FD6D9D4